MQEEKAFLERLEEERQLRQRNATKRKIKKASIGHDDDVYDPRARRRHNMALAHQNPRFKGRLLFGLTVTVGVAAVAMYAINSKDPQDILSKFYHLLSYKNF